MTGRLLKLANRAFSTLSVAMQPTDLAAVIQNGDQGRFPSPNVAAGEYFRATIYHPTNLPPNDREIVTVNARSSNQLKILARAQEGTTAQAFPAGSIVRLALTKQDLDDYRQYPQGELTIQAGQALNAADLVNWQNNATAQRILSAIGAVTDVSGAAANTNLFVCALSSSAALVVWGRTSDTHLVGVVLSISGTTITVGAISDISGAAAAAANPAGCAFSSSSAIVSWQRASDTHLVGVVLSISGTTITVGAISDISGGVGGNPAVDALSANLAVVSWGRGSDGHIIAGVVSIGGGVITVAVISDVSGAQAVNVSTVCALSPDLAIVSWERNADAHILAVGISISGTTITVGAISDISGAVVGAGPTICALSANLAVVAWQRASDTHLVGVVLSISGTTITVGAISDISGAGTISRAVVYQLSANLAAFAWQSGVTGHIAAAVVSISGTMIAAGGLADISGAAGGVPTVCALSSSLAVAAWQRNADTHIVATEVPSGEMGNQPQAIALDAIGNGTSGPIGSRGSSFESDWPAFAAGQEYWPGSGAQPDPGGAYYPLELAANPLLFVRQPIAKAISAQLLEGIT